MEGNPEVRIIPAKKEKIRIEKVGIYARVSTAGKPVPEQTRGINWPEPEG